jgi:hypothetical protein
MKEIDYAWLSGIVDGEGCITIFRRTNKSSNGNTIISPAASATITNTNCLMLEKCIKIFDDVGIKYSYLNPRNSNTRKVMRVQIRNYDSLKKFVSIMKPYLVAKKKQLEILEEFLLEAEKSRSKERSFRKMSLLEEIQKENKYGSQIL